MLPLACLCAACSLSPPPHPSHLPSFSWGTSPVSVDAARAFDHVGVPLLLRLVEPLLQHEQYVVMKYSEV